METLYLSSEPKTTECTHCRSQVMPDDELAAALFKLALIEQYCREEISAREVERFFAETPALKAA